MKNLISKSNRKVLGILCLLGSSALLISCLMKFSEKPDLCFDQAGNKTYGMGGDIFSGQIYPILKEKCSGCHTVNGASEAPSLKLGSAEQAYNTIVNQPSFQLPAVAPNILIVPKNLEQSYLYQKISSDKFKFGERMPKGGMLTAAEIKLIGTWILAGAPKPGRGSGGASNTLITCNAPCDPELAKDRNSPCHPCNSANPPAYCVDANFFRDTIIHDFAMKCFSCHNSSAPQGGIILDTTQSEGSNSKLLKERYKDIYNNLVGCGSYTRGTLYPEMRIAPSDLSGSLLYQSITMNDSIRKEYSKDNIPDSLQYKLIDWMPANSPNGLWDGASDSIRPEHPMIKHMRNWILSGAPGPGDLDNIQEKTDREKFVNDSLKAVRDKFITDSLMLELEKLNPPAKRKQ